MADFLMLETQQIIIEIVHSSYFQKFLVERT